MAAKTDKKAKAAPVALPSLDSIESVEPDALPQSTRGTLADDEKAFAEAVIKAATPPNAARGPEIKERKDAQSAAARIKRLLIAFYRHAGTAPAETPTIKTSVVPKGSGFSWAIRIVAATAESAPEDAPDAEETTETNGDAEGTPEGDATE